MDKYQKFYLEKMISDGFAKPSDNREELLLEGQELIENYKQRHGSYPTDQQWAEHLNKVASKMKALIELKNS